MTDSTSNVGLSQLVGSVDLGPGANSIQFQFAKLQLLLAELNKSQAMSYMDEITAEQDKAKEVAEMIEIGRELQAAGHSISQYSSGGDENSQKANQLMTFMEENNLSWKAGGDKDSWDYNLTSLKNYQEQIGTDTQQKMVFLQDYMGQYNSYLTGASSAIQEANQVLQTIARGQ